MKKITYVVINFIPVLLMIVLIPILKNDYVLCAVYVLIILISFKIKREPKEIEIYFLGLIALTISEAIFVSTGVETFTRRTAFNIMPVWLPVLWGYAFVAIKRGVLVI